MLVATDAYGDKTVVQQIAQSGAITRQFAIRNSLPLSFDPSGTHLLYLAGHSPPTVTETTIDNGQITNDWWRDRILALGALAW